MGLGTGKRRREKRLKWYEKVCCCCKLRAEFAKTACVILLYVIPITLMLSITVAAATMGIYFLINKDCSINEKIPMYLITCSVTPYFLLFFIKGVKSKGHGLSVWRFLSLLCYLLFGAWLIVGSVWVFEGFSEWLDQLFEGCHSGLMLFTFVVVCVHWLLLVLDTIPQVYILTRVCCCCQDDTVEPEVEEPEEAVAEKHSRKY